MLYTLTRSVILESVEKAEALQDTEIDLNSINNTIETSRESRALEYIIRLISRERVKINQGVEVVKYLLSL
jgi:hypothetical protein